ncbi:MAG: hypothetical protein ACKOPM_05520 [Novosphingobium sp.]
MNDAESRLSADRSTRQAARGLFDTRLARVKADLAARPVPQRIKAKAQDEVFRAADLAIDVAKESKGIIAASAGAIALWIFREPLVRTLSGWFAKSPVQEQTDSAAETDEQEHEA